MSTEQVIRKRIVCFHSTGPFAGFARLTGLLEGTRDQVACATLPSFSFKETGKEKTMVHWKTLPRAIWYREWALTTAGRLNEFHGSQI